MRKAGSERVVRARLPRFGQLPVDAATQRRPTCADCHWTGQQMARQAGAVHVIVVRLQDLDRWLRSGHFGTPQPQGCAHRRAETLGKTASEPLARQRSSGVWVAELCGFLQCRHQRPLFRLPRSPRRATSMAWGGGLCLSTARRAKCSSASMCSRNLPLSNR